MGLCESKAIWLKLAAISELLSLARGAGRTTTLIFFAAVNKL
jgi:hypothetical protein